MTKGNKWGKAGGNNNNLDNYMVNGQPDDPDMPRWAKRLEENLMGQLQSINDKLTRDGAEIEALKDRTCDLEYHTRKYNLLIFGLKPGKDCEQTVIDFFKSDLEIADADRMLFAACHPIPSPNRDSCIVRFLRLKDKDTVLRSLPKLRGKGKKISVVTDLPKPLREKRSMLSKTVGDGRKRGESLRLRERGQNVWIEELKDGNWVKRV
jgi:hypothetical protein